MMMRFKKQLSVAMIFLGGLSLSPVLALAQEKVAVIDAKDFCTRFNEIQAKIISDVTAKEKAIIDARTEGETLLREKWAAEETERQASWTKEDTEYVALFKALSDKAKDASEETKDGVSAFKKDIENSKKDFRKSVADIVVKYEDDMETITVKRNEAVDGIVRSYKSGILDAVQKATVDCANVNESPLKVRATFKAELKKLEDKLVSDIKSTEKIEEDIAILGENKTKSLKEAEGAFKKAVEAAGEKLKLVV